MTDWQKVHQDVKEWIDEASKKIIASFNTKLSINSKANANDLVTNLDKETEIYFANQIRNAYPKHRMLGEEGYGDKVEDLSGVVWIIDPIDGTMNFVHQQRNFFISIGIYEDGVGKLGYIYDVVQNELYYAIKGQGAYLNEKRLPVLTEGTIAESIIGLSSTWLVNNKHLDVNNTLFPLIKDIRSTRAYGSAALEFSYVATGRLDAYINMRLSPWDIAGGKVIVEELGGTVSNLKGEPISLLESGPVVVGRPYVHETIISKYLT